MDVLCEPWARRRQKGPLRSLSAALWQSTSTHPGGLSLTRYHQIYNRLELLLFCIHVIAVIHKPDFVRVALQAQFRPDRCAAGIILSDDYTVATKPGAISHNTSVLLSRPAPDSKGTLTVTLQYTRSEYLCLGWVLPDFDPNTKLDDSTFSYVNFNLEFDRLDDAFGSFALGSFVHAMNGWLYGLGRRGDAPLPTVYSPEGGTLSLRVFLQSKIPTS